VLTTYRQNPSSLKPFDQKYVTDHVASFFKNYNIDRDHFAYDLLQARILIRPDFFIDESKIKTFRYFWPNSIMVNEKAYRAKIRELISEKVKQWVTKYLANDPSVKIPAYAQDMPLFKELKIFKQTATSPLSGKLVRLKDALFSLKLRLETLRSRLTTLKMRVRPTRA
jgi:hypothetical protein